MLAQVRQHYAIELPLRALFEAPTVEALAHRVDAALSGAAGRRPRALPLVPLARDGAPLPLSFAQQRLWFLNQLDGRSASYNMPVAVRLNGRLDVDALRRTLDIIVGRHESLRTRFILIDGSPRQLVDERIAFDVPLDDLAALPPVQREAEVRRLTQAEARTPFDLEQGPLLRARVLRLSGDEHIALLTLHHIVSDGWSMGVLVREVATVYAALVRGETPALRELPIQYADYAHWQREWLQGEVLDAQLAYWKQQLADAPVLLSLPTDRPRPPVQRHMGATFEFRVDTATTAGLNTLARESQATLFMVLAAAFNVLLARLRGPGRDLHRHAGGEPHARRGGRADRLLRQHAAYCARGCRAIRRSRRCLRRCARRRWARTRIRTCRSSSWWRCCSRRADLAHSPLFQVMLVLQNAPGETLELPQLRLDAVPAAEHDAKFDLTLTLEERGDGLHARLTYDTDLFDASTLERLMERFTRLLSGIVADPQTRIGALPMLEEAERQQALQRWRGPEVAIGSGMCLPRLFEAQAARTPDAPAVMSGEATLSYRELDAAANRLAHYLRAQGVGAEVRVALCLERSVEMVVALLAVLKAGGAYVPLDPAYPAERLAYMLEHSAPAVLVTQQSLKPRPLAQVPVPSTLLVDAQAGLLAGLPEHAVDVTIDGRHPAYVIYTSGSTGRPKGVLHSPCCTDGLPARDAEPARTGGG